MEQVLIFFGCPLLIHRHTHTHTHTHTKHTVFPILDGKQIHVKYCLETVCKQFPKSLQTVWKQCSQTVCKHCFQTMFPGVDRPLGDNLENTSESREHTFTAQHTQVLTPQTPRKTGGRPASGGPVGSPQLPLSAARFLLSPGEARRASRRRKLLTPRRGHVMQGWVYRVCV